MRELPSGWEWTTLGDTCDVVGGATPKTAVDQYWGGPVPWVTPDDLSRHRGRGISCGARSLTEEGFRSASVTMLPVGTVLFSSRAPIGYVAIAEVPLCTNQGFKSVVPPSGLSSNYLYWYLKHATPLIDSMASGTTFKEISKRRMQEVPLPIPPAAEQERIVAAIEEHLSRLDAAEHSLRSARARLATFRSATTSEALKGDWPVVRLGTHTVDQRYGSSAKASRTGDVPVLRMGNIVDGHLDFGDLKYLPADHPDLDTCDLALGDLLFNRTNSPELVGKSAVFTGHPTEVTFASYLIRVRLDEELDPHWAATVINSPIGRRYIDTVRTQQVGQANVNGTKLKDFPIPIPPIQVQRDRLAQLQLARGWLESVESEISRALMRAAGLRRSILTAAFSGQLVPQDPDDEPASALLERIRAERASAAPTKRTRKAKAS